MRDPPRQRFPDGIDGMPRRILPVLAERRDLRQIGARHEERAVVVGARE